MSKKQSSVEYFMDMIKLNSKDFYAILFEDKVFEQAKAMHREEIKEAYYYDPNSDEIKDDGEEYYNETFGGNNE